MPVVPSTAVRRGGTAKLTEEIDRLISSLPQATTAAWQPPSADEVRTLHREVERILKLAVKPPARPDTWTARLDTILLHPVFGVTILLAILFFMFQAVFAWATPAMDVIKAGFDALGELVKIGRAHV